MRILFVADGRSPIALNWISYFIENRHEVHLASSYPAAPDLSLASLHIVPTAFSNAVGAKSQNNPRRSGGLIRRLSTAGIRTKVRQWLGPLTLPKAAKKMRAVVEEVQPDLVHALRIPYEGMLAALANPAPPLLISVWGNDFTLHGRTTPLMKYYTQMAACRADALMADCQRDIDLAHTWSLPVDRPTKLLPGGGGIQPAIFYPLPDADVPDPVKSRLTVINPRGIRAYVRNDTFFKAIPIVLFKRPETRFICTTMQGEAAAEKWVRDLNLEDYVSLLPHQSRQGMAELFRQAQVAVSPSEHDGTPNTLLEAMACGCFPVAGDIESLREWITHGENGLLAAPSDPQALADAIIRALKDTELRARAAEHNARLIRERAMYTDVMGAAEAFYRQVIG